MKRPDDSPSLRKAGYINPHRQFSGAFCPNWLLFRKEISPGAKLCYARLCNFAAATGVAWPAQATLAAELGVSREQVNDYVKELVAWELIEVDRRGLTLTNRYRFPDHIWMQCPEESPPDVTPSSLPEVNSTSLQEVNSTSLHSKRIIEERVPEPASPSQTQEKRGDAPSQNTKGAQFKRWSHMPDIYRRYVDADSEDCTLTDTKLTWLFVDAHDAHVQAGKYTIQDVIDRIAELVKWSWTNPRVEQLMDARHEAYCADHRGYVKDMAEIAAQKAQASQRQEAQNATR